MSRLLCNSLVRRWRCVLTMEEKCAFDVAGYIVDTRSLIDLLEASRVKFDLVMRWYTLYDIY